ncbi:MAG TPA: class I SAM-dependent methyltransferase [Thiotrichaceae bacterium]|nr:class I SAM-dependent methyltransferase [Thiotrichaceae bacterium]
MKSIRTVIPRFFNFERRFPRLRKTVWKGLYGFLAWRFPTEEWFFMNYGYAYANPEEQPELLPEDEKNSYFIHLYAQTLQPVELAHQDILEVGSGRGGGSEWIARTQNVKSMTSVDLSSNAISLCQKNHKLPNLTFKQGDAEKLPFPDHAFDIVLNIESSHHYPSMPTFLQEVKRVLKPGGYFCLADYRDLPEVEDFKQHLDASGLERLQLIDITDNVIKALDLTNDVKQNMIERQVPRFLLDAFKTFAAVKDTEVYNRFVDGRLIYLSTLLRKNKEEVE